LVVGFTLQSGGLQFETWYLLKKSA